MIILVLFTQILSETEKARRDEHTHLSSVPAKRQVNEARWLYNKIYKISLKEHQFREYIIL